MTSALGDHLDVSYDDHASAGRHQRRDKLTDEDTLRAAEHWEFASSPDDEMPANECRLGFDLVRAVTDSTYQAFESSAIAAGIDDPEAIADILYLYCRGYHVKAVEDPAAWSDERVSRSIGRLLESLLGISSPLATRASDANA